MKKVQILVFLIFYIVINAFGADSKKKVQMSFYEVGDSIVDYDTNFKNLFHNWTADNLTNAPDYKLLNYTYLETITDSTILDFYGIFMTTRANMIGLSSKSSERMSLIGVREVKYAVEPTQFSLDSLFTVKNQRLRKLYEDRLFVHEIKRIYSDGFSMREDKPGKVAIYRSPDLLSDDEYKAFLLNAAKTERAMAQLYFQQFVHIGDAVYVVHFRYLNKLYSDYVVCDSKTKRVKIDGFFKRVHLWVDVE